MNGVWALVPTKELTLAKSRLAPLLEPTQRRDLVHVMLVDVLRVLLAAPGLAGVAVIGRAPSLLALAASQGALVLHDERGDLNGALAQGAAQLAERGASALLIVPGDVPLVTPADIAALLAPGAQGGIAIAPSPDGGNERPRDAAARPDRVSLRGGELRGAPRPGAGAGPARAHPPLAHARARHRHRRRPVRPGGATGRTRHPRAATRVGTSALCVA